MKRVAGRAPRVLIVVQNLPVPFDRRVWLEATSLHANGYAVSVICPKAKGFNRSRERLEGIDIYRYPLPFEARGKLGYIAEFLWCFAATALLSGRVALFGGGFDILHVCNPPETYWPLGWFWRAFGRIFIFDHHDLSPEMAAVKFGRDRGVLIRALLWLEKATFRAAQVVITTNESHKAIAVARGGKRPDDVYIVRSGPELSRFRLYEPDPGVKNGKPHAIVYLGEICEQDGVDYLLRALKILRDEFGRRDFHCVLIGGGPHQPAMDAYAREIGVEELCTFTGRISDEALCRILSSADIAIDPDPKNPWSDKSTMNKIVEYMYFRLPIVAFDLAESRVSAAEAALFVEPNVERELARGVAELLDDPQRRAAMGACGGNRVRERLAWQYSVPPLLAAYEAACALRRR
ncbi:MAG TPA: glycosyltransferase family 4 protein [Stellaceae bacterium]|nr:glycosyltransferase family 4 protein [Stellaceae bacterium]